MKKKMIAALTSLSLMLSPISASGEPVSTTAIGAAIGVNFSYTASTTSTTVGVGLSIYVLSLVFSKSNEAKDKIRESPHRDRSRDQTVERTQPARDAELAAAYFLKDNAVQLASDLSVGHGPVLETFAGVLHIPLEHRAAMGQLLQRHQNTLISLLPMEQASIEHAEPFFQHFLQVLEKDEVLAEDIRKLLI